MNVLLYAKLVYFLKDVHLFKVRNRIDYKQDSNIKMCRKMTHFIKDRPLSKSAWFKAGDIYYISGKCCS